MKPTKTSTLIIMFIFFTGLNFVGLSAPDEAMHVVTVSGYKNIKITGYEFYGCGESDFFRTGFEASAPNGTQVKGVVCSGLFKGATLRLK
jgi:hypothetical protein